MNAPQRALELILARNLLASLTTAALLVDHTGTVAYYNEAAGDVLGRRFEECGPMTAEDWGTTHGPFGDAGEPIPFEDLELTQGLVKGRPGHFRFHIRAMDGADHLIEASAMPIVATGGRRGAMVFFWPVEAEEGP